MYIYYFVIGFILGFVLFKVFDKGAYGIIEVNDEDESYFFKMSSKDIKNPKIRKIVFKIVHKNSQE